jgi:threonine/homoserine/homoserine lactone efflux protein
LWEDVKLAVKTKTNSIVVDRENQRKTWFNQFFNSHVLKVIGVAWLFIFILLVVFSICLICNHNDYANQVWGLTEKLILLVFGAMFSAVGIKVESADKI